MIVFLCFKFEIFAIFSCVWYCELWDLRSSSITLGLGHLFGPRQSQLSVIKVTDSVFQLQNDWSWVPLGCRALNIFCSLWPAWEYMQHIVTYSWKHYFLLI